MTLAFSGGLSGGCHFCSNFCTNVETLGSELSSSSNIYSCRSSALSILRMYLQNNDTLLHVCTMKIFFVGTVAGRDLGLELSCSSNIYFCRTSVMLIVTLRMCLQKHNSLVGCRDRLRLYLLQPLIPSSTLTAIPL